MPLTTYDEVRPWARAIKDQILTRRMPIWHAAHGYGAFANDPSLTPAEMATVAAWVDGGQPRSVPGSSGSPGAPGSGSPGSPRDRVVSAFRRDSAPLVVAASATDARVRIDAGWIAGWYFEPGDPLITSATFTSADGRPIGTWTAGDGPVRLFADAGLAVTSPLSISVQRRKAADYEKPSTAKRSILRLLPLTEEPKRRVWVEEAACGAPRTSRSATLLAIRPRLAAGASARMWLERPGAPRAIVGWFRDTDPRYPRTYWLARGTELPPESRLQSDVSCTVELTFVR
jgi:hypothetical protein